MKTIVKCRIDIRKGIIKKVINSNTTKNIKKVNEDVLFLDNSLFKDDKTTHNIAKSVTESINKQFDSELAFQNSKTNGQEIKINPSEELVNEYYKEYTKDYNILQNLEQSVDQFGDSNTNLEDLYRNAMNLNEEVIENRIKQCE